VGFCSPPQTAPHKTGFRLVDEQLKAADVVTSWPLFIQLLQFIAAHFLPADSFYGSAGNVPVYTFCLDIFPLTRLL